MNQATKLMIELLEDHAENIYLEYCSDEHQLDVVAYKYFFDIVEREIENDLLGVLLQEVTDLVDWTKVSQMIIDQNICYK